MTKGRVIEAHRTNFTVAFDNRELLATVRGNFHVAKDFPKVGDYVSLELLEDDKAVIEEVLERKTVIKRKAADADEEQIIATNVDYIFIVMGLDGDYSLSRLERYLLLAQQSAIDTIVVLNKIDLANDLNSLLREAAGVVGDTPVIAVSATTGSNMGEFLNYVKSGSTAVLLGSSGAGKSTITNWLLEETKQEVNETRLDDSRGRHTTTSRQLFTLPNGGYLIDTPGMRELGVLDTDAEDELAVFEKIEQFSLECKFNDCDHEKSVGCAVLAAVESGAVTERELANYHKLLRERAFLESKDSTAAARHHNQNQKRQSQKYAAIQRQKLSRGKY
ncbi:ribosome small subunit-dependent GTPase A [Candidatus Nomurabacteria bacterium]|nr:ribosome small subunit-dependent GTPase A [Candidatus Kaiserbacteria bacterium]MCB9815256.1 ribosome small subunit-dependent GTPase A [Candidatus Nomurabacteria bacterium]